MNSEPVFQRCIAMRQWQNAAAIRGCSIDAIRGTYDDTYLRADPKAAESVVYAAPAKVAAPRYRVRNTNRPMSSEWVAAFKSDMRALCLDISKVALAIHTNRKGLLSALQPSGHMSDAMLARINAYIALERLCQHQEAAQ